ncbi:hypothetical protein POM88_024874 [Heracleum sosnowskyi]|uniref:Uncharacterized protein n=1 Tax=Heracleum sosnowskyi TaxID=360622 RepID=A0AAD8I5Z1_9APIA|nr:hypothetical protein POM88_024874 [Heracleum sosnowskyi]
MVHDMREEYSAPRWVLNKLETTKHEEMENICVVLWGIWYWRNKKVWNNQVINPYIVIENSLNVLREWKSVRKKVQQVNREAVGRDAEDKRWKPPEIGTFKLNVDAAYRVEDSTFSIGMVIRDHSGPGVGLDGHRHQNPNRYCVLFSSSGNKGSSV